MEGPSTPQPNRTGGTCATQVTAGEEGSLRGARRDPWRTTPKEERVSTARRGPGPAGASRAWFSALLLAVVVCAGCQARLAVDVTVTGDGAGRLAVALSADEELRRRAQEAGADPLDDLARTGEQLEDAGWEVADRTAPDGTRRVTLAAPFADPAAFAALASELQGALDAPELTLLDELAVAVEEDTVAVTGTASLVPTPAITSLGLQPEQAVALIADADAFVYEVRVGLPGEVLRSNGAVDAEARTVTWTVAPGETVAIAAVARRPGPPALLLAAFAAAGGLAALLIGLRLVRRPPS